MATVINTMYPPQIGGSGTFAPSFPVSWKDAGENKFVVDGDAEVLFSISQYNSITNIKGVHVTCVNMASNVNALDASTGVYYIPFDKIEQASTGEYSLHITSLANTDVNSAKMKGEGFTTGMYYKVQLRFDQTKEGTKAGPLTEEYLSTNLKNFSEWSTVCLIRPIGTPVVLLNTWGDIEDDTVPSFNKGTIPIAGNVSFYVRNTSDSKMSYIDSTEQLESYKIKVYSDKTGELMTETPTIYCQDGKSINYALDVEGYSSSAGDKFHIIMDFVSVNQYKWSSKEDDMPFSISSYSRNDSFKPTITVESLKDDGAVRVHITNKIAIRGFLCLKRTSAESNYETWESLDTRFVNSAVDYTYDDMTVCSGIFYRYSIQLVEPETFSTGTAIEGRCTKAYKSNKIMCDFYDAMFYRLGRQVSMRYDFTISSLKPVVNRSKVDTLGGKYPKFVENAQMRYKQFSISGIISSQTDPNVRFFKKSDLYGVAMQDMDSYNKEEAIRDNYDYYWERGFREEVVSWLNDGEPKLMRTMTEGNVCVMLTDISLTPNKVLGRRICSFTATAYEVESGISLDTLVELGIHSVGEEKAIKDYENSKESSGETGTIVVTKLSQLYNTSPWIEKVEGNTHMVLNSDVAEVIVNKKMSDLGKGILKKYQYKPGSLKLKDVKIYFHNKPHVFYVDSDGALQPHEYTKTSYGSVRPEESKTNEESLLIGYRFSLNGKTIFVNRDGYYQIPSSIEIDKLGFPDAKRGEDDCDVVTLDYVVTHERVIDRSNADFSDGTMSVYKTVAGQVNGRFYPEERLGDRIYNRYAYKEQVKENDVVTQTKRYKMEYWKGVSLEVDPYAVFAVEFEDDFEYKYFTVGESGIFNIEDGFPCEDLYFKGIKIFRRKGNSNITLGEFGLSGKDENGNSQPATLVDLSKAVPGYVYTVNGKTKYYSLDKKWYNFEQVKESNYEAGIIDAVVSGNVNYVGEILVSTMIGG